jgi:hypothetical protein
VVEDETGELTCSQPFPCMPVSFWNDPDGAKYRAAYFETHPGIWSHGDYARLTERGGVIIYGRSDATLNPGGVRIGTAEIYRQVEKLDEILESICVGQDFDGDVRVVLFVRLSEGVVLDDDLRDRIRKTIRANTTPRHVPAKDRGGARHPAHRLGQDHRTGRARCHPRPGSQEHLGPGQSGSAGALPRLAGAGRVGYVMVPAEQPGPVVSCGLVPCACRWSVMKRSIALVAVLVAVILLAACGREAGEPEATTVRLSGEAHYLERIVMPPGSWLEVELIDEDSEQVLASTRIEDAETPPFSFELEVEADDWRSVR